MKSIDSSGDRNNRNEMSLWEWIGWQKSPYCACEQLRSVFNVSEALHGKRILCFHSEYEFKREWFFRVSKQINVVFFGKWLSMRRSIWNSSWIFSVCHDPNWRKLIIKRTDSWQFNQRISMQFDFCQNLALSHSLSGSLNVPISPFFLSFPSSDQIEWKAYAVVYRIVYENMELACSVDMRAT